MRAVHSFSKGIVAIAGAVVFAILTGAPAAAQGPTPCEATAQVIREAARHAAWQDAWLKVAICVNDPGCPLPQYLQVILAELQDDLALAQEQYLARLDVCEDLGPGRYDPRIDPAEFSAHVDNPYFPLVPGRKLVYEGQKAGHVERSELTALDQTAVIDGVTCRVVSDVVTIDDELTEDTLDYYAQHQNQDVWYFGEVSKNYVDGFLDNLEGSWRSGRSGAKPGIQMLAAPALDQVYRQEFLVNEAEDIAEIASLDETVTVSYGTFAHCLVTEESTPLEPDVLSRKYYAPGIGLVLEVDLQTGDRIELVDIK
ncbi:MAG: hypothetical protein U1E76_06685 [Planctomycetota bacterium]